MALKDTINNFLRSLASRFNPSATTTTMEAPVQSSTARTSTKFALEGHRRAIVNDARKMYNEDDRVEAILSTLARDATRGSFSVEVMDGPSASVVEQAQELANDLIKRLDLEDRLDDWARLSFRDGDTFIELGVSGANAVEQATRKPTLLMHRNSNSADEFDDPTKAYWLSDKTWAAEPPTDAIWFAEWQIIHSRWMHDEGKRYGKPLFNAARTAYKRMREGEFDMAIRRKTRAGLKLLHVVEGADDAGIKAYRARNRDVLSDPFAAVADFFSSTKGSITAIQGDSQLGNINDVTHHIETFWVASPVPMSLLGYGRDLNRDVLDEQKEQYDEILPTVTKWVETQFLKPLIELEWMLNGIWPEELQWHVVWNVKQILSAEDVQNVAQAVSVMQGTGLVDERTLLDIIEVFLPTVDLTRAREELEKRLKNEESHMGTAAALARKALEDQEDEEGGEGDSDEDEKEEATSWLKRVLGSQNSKSNGGASGSPDPAPSFLTRRTGTTGKYPG